MQIFYMPRPESVPVLKKILSVMRLTSFALIAFSIHLSASVYSQQTKLSLDIRNQSIKDVLFEIESQSEFRFIYESGKMNLDKKVSVRVKNQTVETILSRLFEKEKVAYEITESNLILINPEDLEGAGSHKLTGISQQKRKVTGMVTDTHGEPIIGANVIEKGTTNGMITDLDGKFSLDIEVNAILQVSYIGYISQEISVKNQNSLSVILAEDFQALEEVVVVGYGTQKKSDLTGAIVNVKMSDLKGLPESNLTTALSGRLAGVSIQQNGGGPNSGVKIRIRGTGTLNNNDPLVVIDDIIGADLNLLNPNDIETMTVLKDASASAIYGSRAASGVIIVKTKRGTGPEGTHVNFGAYYGLDKVTKKLDVLSAGQLATIYNEASRNDGSTPFPEFADPSSMKDITNWQDEIFRTAHVQNYNLGISNNGPKSNLNASFNIQNNEGTMLNTYDKRYTARFNSDMKIGNKIKVGESISISYIDSKGANTRSDNSGAILMALGMHPDVPVYYADGTYHGVPSSNYGDIENPVGLLKRNNGHDHNYKLEGNAYAQLEIIEGLNLKTSGSLLWSTNDVKKFYQIKPEPGRPSGDNSLEHGRSLNQKWIWETTLNYDKTIAQHRISAMAGYTVEHNEWDNEIKGTKKDYDFEDENFWYLDAGTQLNALTGGFKESGLMSFLFRANYAYADKYLVGVNFRSDGSSKFAKKNRWGYFPSASLGWRISQETFMENISWLNDLKIRGSYGSLGNESIDPYQIMNVYKMSDAFARYEFGPGGSNLHQGAVAGKMGNPDLKWETTTQTNVGFDAVLFENAVSLTVDYFYKKTKDILVDPPMLGVFGMAGNQQINGATVVNKGFEATVNYYSDRQKDFTYDLSLNFTTFNNEVTSLGNAVQPIYGPVVRDAFPVTKTDVGHAIASFYGYKTDGIFKSDEEAASYVNGKGERLLPNAQGGDFRFVDTNNDGVIDASDRVILGDAIPDFTYGLNASFYYKNFDLNMFFQGVQGVDNWYSLRYQVGFTGLKYNYLEEVWGRWTPENPNASRPRATFSDPNNNKRPSDYYIEDGSYLRLKNLTLGYTLPKKWLNTMGINQLRVYASVQNLFTITSYPGFDPELGLTDGSDKEAGVDRGQYPHSRTISFGLSLGF